MSAAPAPAAAAATERRPWRELAGIMSGSAVCALASGCLSAAASKIIALLAGPAALGLLGSLQQIRETALTGATANGGTALVQGASALRDGGRAAYVRTAGLIFAGATALTAGLLGLAPAEVARWGGLPASDAPLVQGLIVAVLCSSVFVFLSALLNGLGAAGRVALLQLAGPGAMAVLAWPAARSGSFVFLLGASAGVTVAAAGCALLAYRRTFTGWWKAAGYRSLNGAAGGSLQAAAGDSLQAAAGDSLQAAAGCFSGSAARRFFSISGAMLFTGLAASASFLAVRAGIVRVEGLAVAGQFDAAWSISMNQVSLVLASLQTHYLPALARSQSPAERRGTIAGVLTLAAPASALIIATLACAKPLWLTLLYSPQFHPAARYLRWTLAGDYLKVSSWILSIPMLAGADMRMFLAADLAATAAFLLSALWLARLRTPSEAASIAFLLMHAVHLAAGGCYLRLRHGFRWPRSAALSWLGGAALVAGVSLWKWNA